MPRIKLYCLISFSIGYIVLFIMFSGLKTIRKVNNSAYEDEEVNKKLLKIVKAQKSLPVSGDLSRKCYAENSEYNVTVDGVKYPKKVPLMYNTSIDFECLNQQNYATRIILSWNSFIDMTFNKEACPVKNCVLTFDRRFQEYADYVVFHGPDFDEPKGLPPKVAARPAFQRWIFASFESPFNTEALNTRLPDYNGVFNLTATYLEESDFEDIYELTGLKWEKNDDYDPNQDVSENKDGVVAALISNCKSRDRTNRFRYLQELGKHTQVDIFGGCGRQCPKRNVTCRDWLYSKYLFVFAAENSMCKDYITEKFFLAIRNNVVPIVLGGGDYEKYVPRSGFINALDFPMPNQMGTYLNYLKSNKTAYNEFFKWKQHVRFQNEPANLICSMCIRLNLEAQFGVQPSVVQDLVSYWNVKQCKVARTESVVVFKFDQYVDLDSAQYLADVLQTHTSQIYVYSVLSVCVLFLTLACFCIQKLSASK